MNSVIKSLLTFVAVGLGVIVLGQLAIYRQEHRSLAGAGVLVPNPATAARKAEVEAAEKEFTAQVEKETATYEEEKKNEELRELADLSHEVRLLRVEVEHRAALLAIERKYAIPKP